MGKSLARSLLVAFLLALLVVACAKRSTSAEGGALALPKADASLVAAPADSVEALAAQPTGVYAVDAVVTRINFCPPCEGPAPCSPCAPTGIVVASRPPPLGEEGRGVYLFTAYMAAFREGARYRLTVQVTARDGGDGAIELLGADELRDDARARDGGP